jgi:pyruvate dehydrogenase E2 component (dihydrolipoamide acetyltransferase)
MAIIIMPKQGLQMTEGVITRWLKKEGEMVAEGEPLFEMETDKLAITIDSSASGVLGKILRAEGDTVPVAEPIAVIGAEDGIPLPAKSASDETASAGKAQNAPSAPEPPVEKRAPSPAPTIPAIAVEKPARSAAPKPSVAAPERRFATPRAKMRAEERGFDWKAIPGTGPDGLVIERDVLVYQQPAQPAFTALAFQAVQVDMTEAKRLIELFAAHGFPFGAADLMERAAARTGELLGVSLTARTSKADLSVASSPDTLTLGETGPSGTAWLTLPCAGEPDQTVSVLRQVQTLLEHPPLLL